MAIPTETPTVQITPGPVADTSSGLTQLSKLFSNMQTSFEGKFLAAREKSAEESGIAAREAGQTQPASNFTVAGQAYNKGAEFADKYMTSNAALLQSNEILNNAQTHVNGPESISGYQEAMTKSGQTLINQALPANRLYISNILNNQLLHGTMALEKSVRTQGKAVAFGQLNDTFTNYVTAGVAAAQVGDKQSAATYMGKMQNLFSTLTQQQTMKPHEAARYIQHGQTEINTAVALHEYQQAPDKVAWLKNFQTGAEWAQVPPDQKKIMLSAIQSQENRVRSLSGITKQSSKHLQNNYLEQQRLGAPANPAIENEILAQNAEDAPEIKANWAIAKSFGAEWNEAQTDNIATLNNKIATLHAPLTKAQVQSPELLRVERYRNALRNQLTSYRKTLISDPIQVMEGDTAYIKANKQIRLSNITETPNTQDPVYNHQLRQYQTAIDNFSLNWQTQHGIPAKDQKLLSNVQAASQAARINSLPFPEQPAALLAIDERYGKNAAIVFHQLATHHIPIGASVVAAMLKNPKTQGMVPDALAAFQEKTNVLADAVPKLIGATTIKNKVKQLLQPWNTTMGDRLGDTTPVINNTINLATDLAYKLATKSGASASGVAQTAVNAIIGDQYQQISFAGHDLFLPHNDQNKMPINAGIVKQGMAALRNNIILNKNVELTFPQYKKTDFQNLPQSFRDQLYRNSLNKGYFRTLPDDSGIEFVDSNGIPVRFKDGKVVEFKYTDLTNPESVVSQLITTQLKPQDFDRLLKTGFENFPLSSQIAQSIGMVGVNKRAFLDPLSRVTQ